MATAQKVNYSAELTAQIVSSYENGVAIEQIAQESGKSVRSLRAKLSQLGVYKTTKTAAKNPSAGITRAKLVRLLEQKLGMEEFDLQSLESAKKDQLEALVLAIKN